MATQFAPHGDRFQFNQSTSWIPAFGIHYAVGVDGIALVLILMTAVLWPVVILASWHECETTQAQREDLPRAPRGDGDAC